MRDVRIRRVAANERALRSLRQRWAILSFIWFLVVLVFYFLLKLNLSAQAALTWLSLTVGALAYQLVILFFDLGKNITIGTKRLSPRFGLGLWLTATRLLLLSLLAGFLLVPRPQTGLAWLPFALALAFNLSDLVDGYLARRSGMTTELGAKLDLDLDGRGMLVNSLLVIHHRQVGWWFALVGLARYIYVAALWLRRRFGLRVKQLAANQLRRPFAGVQMGIVTALLAPIFSAAATNFIATLSMLPFLGNFLYDWLQISGRLANGKQTKLAIKQVAAGATLILRVVVVAFFARRLVLFGLNGPYLIFELLAALCFFFGIAGRPMAMLALIETAVRLKGNTVEIADFVLLFSLTALLYLGMGMFNLWEPEKFLITRRLGEKRAA